MAAELREIRTQLLNLSKDVKLIKDALLGERELSPWAKRQLKRARKEDESEMTSLEELWPTV